MCSLRSNALKKIISQRCFHTTQVSRIDPKTVEEIKIPVPWGHIAGKWWGCRQTRPIVTTHGLYDNAGSYDNLLPLLNTKSVLCLDLPGHGLSSHFPRGLCIHFEQYIYALRYIFTQYFKWDKVSLMCHSFGSSMGFSYAGFYPEHVDRMVNMECSRMWTADHAIGIVDSYSKSIDGFNNDLDNYRVGQGCSWEETISRLAEGRVHFGFPLSRESCEIIAKRATEPCDDNKFRFTHDKRLKFYTFNTYNWNLLHEFAERISCDVLNIIASNGFNKYDCDSINEEFRANLKKLDKGKNLTNVAVDGGHHVHLENPEVVAPILNDFFKN